jgi:ribulose-5-phosphate 4-epimerase/fuculose-1-phosphate aldolase
MLADLFDAVQPRPRRSASAGQKALAVMLGHDVRADLAMVCRILAHHRMIDLWGHASLRVPRSDVVAVTPRFSKRCLPRTIQSTDILISDLNGNLLNGQGVLPHQFAADLAVYRLQSERTACLFASPAMTVAAGIAGREMKPLTHMEASAGYGLRAWNGAGLATDPARSRALAAQMCEATAVQQAGVGVWVAGKDVFDCLVTIYHLEYLAQANLVQSGLQPGNTVDRKDSDKLWSQFSGHHHYIEFLSSLDPGPLVHPYPAFRDKHAASNDVVAELKAAMSFTCRALWERDTLVAFLEHVSHRVPQKNRFLITASRNFRDMAPSDVTLLDLDANWLEGPRPPNFKWFHAQIMAERRDVHAIVHTHDLYGRVYALTAQPLAPIYRLGLDMAMRPLPNYPRCDLIVDPDVRRVTMDALADGPIVHEVAHGTDFVAGTLERATVDAIQREAFLAMDHLARRFGAPHALPAQTVADIRAGEFNAEDWWWFYTAEVGAPRRSAGGL